MNRPFVQPLRYGLLVGVVLASFAALGARLVYLQVVKSEAFRSVAEANRSRIQTLHAQRGNITGADGSLLATTRTFYTVGLDPHSVTSEDRLAFPQVAAALGLTVADLEAAAARRYFTEQTPEGPRPRPRRWVKLIEGVEPEVYERLLELDLDGVYGNRKHVRVYPAGRLAAHVIGFHNEAGYALGVEHCMDYYLRGQDGWRQIERDGRHREIAYFRGRDVPPRPGFGVALTLDAVIQHFVEAELDAIVAAFNPVAATIIVSEPTSGRILALGNRPSFDPNHYHLAEPGDFRNRALTDIHEPGSVFKIIPVAATLSQGLVHPEDTFDCTLNYVTYQGRRYNLATDDHHIGEADVAKILYKSSNSGAGQLAIRLGRKGLYDASRAFGYRSRTGLFLTAEFKALDGWDGATGEVRGQLADPPDWDGLMITRIPIGHAVSATPMQVHRSMGVIASGGLRVTPRLIDRVYDEDGDTVLDFSGPEPVRVLDTETAHLVTEMLEKVPTADGTARRAAIEGYAPAGKTGTSWKVIDGHYHRDKHIGTFTGFLPAWDPQLLITVVVNEPRFKGTGYGGVVAAPAFRNIALKTIQHLGIEGAKPEPAATLTYNNRDPRRGP